MSNKITTLGYFIKRLRDSGYRVDKLYDNYSNSDPRAWTIIIDPGVTSVFCTCYANATQLGEVYFELYDGAQFVPGRFYLKTHSVEVIMEYLNKFNVGKYSNGPTNRPQTSK